MEPLYQPKTRLGSSSSQPSSRSSSGSRQPPSRANSSSSHQPCSSQPASRSSSSSSSHHQQYSQPQPPQTRVSSNSSINQQPPPPPQQVIAPKYGPPSTTKPRSYNVMLELLESQANKKLTQEYHQDVKQWLSHLESTSTVNPAMIDLQPEIQWFMRPFLLDFLIELHASFRLQPATLFLCFNIIDRYCAKRIVFKRHYQLVGCTALWIAGKYEDKKSRVPTLKELSIMCRNAYDEEMFIQMEMHILSTLEWSLSHPNLEECLQLSIQSTCFTNLLQVTPCKYNNLTNTGMADGIGQSINSTNSKVSAISAIGRFLCELSLYDRFFLSMPTSLVAITANILACSMLQINTSSVDLEELIKTHFRKKYAHNNNNDLFLTPKQKKYTHRQQHQQDDEIIIAGSGYESNSEYEEFFTDEDNEDVPQDEKNDNEENKQPNVQGAFLGGFDPVTTFEQIRKIALMFIIQLSKITDVLTRKYEALGVIQVVKNFNQRYSFIMSTIIENSNVIVESATSDASSSSMNKLYHLADIVLQLPQVSEIETSIKNSYVNKGEHKTHSSTMLSIPLTPPSATSQNSIFSLSNHTLSSVCATPINVHHPSQYQNLQNPTQQQHQPAQHQMNPPHAHYAQHYGHAQSSDAIHGFSPVRAKGGYHNSVSDWCSPISKTSC